MSIDRSDVSCSNNATSGADPDTFANELIAKWRAAPQMVVRACYVLVTAIHTLGLKTAEFSAFLRRLVEARVLSENDQLSGLRANGKLAMLKTIGENAKFLLDDELIAVLPPGYSVLYQVALLIERLGFDEAKAVILSLGSGFTREDVINAHSTAANNSAGAGTGADEPIRTAELMLVTLTSSELRVLRQSYADAQTLNLALRRPLPDENSGLVVHVSLLGLPVVERELLPLLGFGKVSRLFIVGSQASADITDGQIIVVAERGGARASSLDSNIFRSAPLDVHTIADQLFPVAGSKCHLFAKTRIAGWHTLIGAENWIQEPAL